MATAKKIINQSATYSDNIVPSFAMFDSVYNWTVSAGSGSGSHDDQYKFAGDRSLKVVNTDVQNTDLTISSGANTQFNIDRDGNYILSWYSLANTVGGTDPISATVQIFISGVPTDYDFTIQTDDFDKWTRYSELVTFTAGDKITFNVKLRQDATSATTSQVFWLDGFMCNEDNRNLGFPPRFKLSIFQDQSVYGAFSNLATQSFLANTPTPIIFNSNDEVQGIGHSETINNDEFSFVFSGVFQMTIEPQLFRSGGSGVDILDVWIQRDIGAGFVNIQNSNIKRTASGTGTTGISPLTSTIRIVSGEKIRFMANVNDTSLDLRYTAASGSIPATPSVILNIVRVGV